MARIRSLHPGLSSDEAYMSMSMAAKAAWPVLWTECDDHGVFEWKPVVLKARIFPADAIDFASLLAEYEGLGCIQKVELEGKPVGLIRNFCRYQRPKKPSYRHEITEPMLDYVGFKKPQSVPSAEPVPNHSPTSTEKPPQMKEEGGSSAVITSGDKPTIRRKAPRRISYPPRFEEFWKGYPTDPLMSKSEALTEWQNLTPEDQEAAIAALSAFKAATAKLGPDHRVIHACRYLKKRRFDGFKDEAEKLAAAASVTQYYAAAESPELEAWDKYRRAERGRGAPRDMNGGWYFPDRWPPGHVCRETSDPLPTPQQTEKAA